MTTAFSDINDKKYMHDASVSWINIGLATGAAGPMPAVIVPAICHHWDRVDIQGGGREGGGGGVGK